MEEKPCERCQQQQQLNVNHKIHAFISIGDWSLDSQYLRPLAPLSVVILLTYNNILIIFMAIIVEEKKNVTNARFFGCVRKVGRLGTVEEQTGLDGGSGRPPSWGDQDTW